MASENRLGGRKPEIYRGTIERMNPSDQYLAKLMMNVMLQPLKHPESSVLVSVFTPCELIQEAGLYPYNVESFSCYLTASQAERAFLQNAEDSGFQRLSAVITKRLLEQQRKASAKTEMHCIYEPCMRCKSSYFSQIGRILSCAGLFD